MIQRNIRHLAIAYQLDGRRSLYGRNTIAAAAAAGAAAAAEAAAAAAVAAAVAVAASAGTARRASAKKKKKEEEEDTGRTHLNDRTIIETVAAASVRPSVRSFAAASSAGAGGGCPIRCC
ncbi:hypothetical protein RB195_026166 [Necator americanus]|uniref:Uncharacterized protein n=1 Tax=Necator americanus TaxID=51031 RepID=A0ABR1EVX4_NECAM